MLFCYLMIVIYPYALGPTQLLRGESHKRRKIIARRKRKRLLMPGPGALQQSLGARPHRVNDRVVIGDLP